MVSILLPISDTEEPKLVDLCLESLANQTYFRALARKRRLPKASSYFRAKRENGGCEAKYRPVPGEADSYKDFEVLIVTSKSSAKKISQVTKKYPFVKILEKDLGKSAARNFAAKNAKGRYIFYIDADMELMPQVLSECTKKAVGGAEAIITPKKGALRPSFWSKCRALEKSLFWGSPSVESPDFIKKSVFEKVGGFDETLDPLDDWDLHLALKKIVIRFERIQTPILVREGASFPTMLRRKYERGRAYPAFRKKYPHPPQLNLSLRLGDYLKNWKRLIKSPHLSLGLFVLKIGDISAFFWGTLHPLKKKSGGSTKHPYMSPKVAEEYDQKRLGNNFGRYKHFAELRSLLQLLPEKDSKILEVGCGTGRITKELVKRGYKVSPIDNSRAMLTQYRQKSGLPKPQLADATRLPFPDNSFPTVVSLRVIWHLLNKEDREKMLSETARVSSSLIILDITNRKRWPKIYLNRHQHDTYFFNWEEFVELCKKYNLRTEEKIPLDTLAPFWLNLLPPNLAMALFPLLYSADLLLSKLIPPGRYLVRLTI